MKKLLLLFAYIFSLSLFATHQWDGKKYNQNSNSQQVAAMKVLENYTFRGDENVLDVGCGDGKITAAILEKVPQGSAVGSDLSPQMIKFARNAFSSNERLNFKVEDAQKLNYQNEFDLVVSFSAMQWMPDQKAVLAGIFNALKSGGHVVKGVSKGSSKGSDLRL